MESKDGGVSIKGHTQASDSWNSKGERVTMARTQLKELQEQMRYVQDDNLVEKYQMEKSLETQLEKWRNIEERATKQKARVL
ncbi:hypothetical protein RDI58_007038 [Solanum bulbocastanum]|uniref:Uncharacterized protein n=1 Tax=Solanum bulbocastanum TaxID=147425 RepID=A0AAN8YI76_SOLBU